ncbi:hypothetical protein HYX04_05375 [Candidatus Woesearchaeota archaeon]|nr:hypothetical protein [Candidatus Woesearchaeota archaeon]
MRLAALFLILFLLSLESSLSAKALAVASDYLEDNTLTLTEENSAIYSIRLQNPDSYEQMVKVDYDNQFMKALDFKEEYTLPPQSSIRIEFNATAPKYDKNNNLFVVSYTVHQLTGPSGGGIPFLTKINKSFKLKVIKNPSKFHIDYDYAAYAVIALAFLLYVFRKKRAWKRSKRKFRKFL